MYEPVLFIGGPMDGKYEFVDPRFDQYQCAVPPPMTIRPPDEEVKFPDIKIVRYRRQWIHSGGLRLSFFRVYEPGQDDELGAFLTLKRVLEYYGGREEREAFVRDEWEKESWALVTQLANFRRERDMLRREIRNLLARLNQEGESPCTAPENPTSQAGSD